MIAISDIKELEKICRKYLISQSQLSGEMVRNSLSTYGETLDKVLSKMIEASICPCDALILFELKSRHSNSDVSMTEVDESITIYKSYTLYIIIYGNDSATLATKLIARLRTEEIRSQLYEEGVYVEKVYNDDSLNEFKNNVMWHRHDFKLDISCMMSVEQTNVEAPFESANINQIIEKENTDE